jgi:GAF domain-containing protein
MTAMLQQAEATPAASVAHGVHSFEELARLIQRTLDCDAVVLSLDHPADSQPMAPRCDRRSGRDVVAAYREGESACARPEPSTLRHPVSAGEQGMRFYAGLPLRDHGGRAIGMLAATDRWERCLATAQLDKLRHLAGMAADIRAVQQLGFAA